MLELHEISKRFGETVALHRASLRVRPGTVHALLGENGAGKTTLMRVAFGLVAPDGGVVRLAGGDGVARERRWRSPADAIAAGVGMVHQHFALVPALTVAENVALGAGAREGWRFDRRAWAARVRDIGARTGLALDPDAVAGELPVGAQQRLEIVKALARDARVLVLDEPTAVLAPAEAAELLRWLRAFADGGRAAVLITHKLREALSVADDVTVLRAGRTVAAMAVGEATEAGLLAALLGTAGQTALGSADEPAGAMRVVEGGADEGRAWSPRHRGTTDAADEHHHFVAQSDEIPRLQPTEPTEPTGATREVEGGAVEGGAVEGGAVEGGVDSGGVDEGGLRSPRHRGTTEPLDAHHHLVADRDAFTRGDDAERVEVVGRAGAGAPVVLAQDLTLHDHRGVPRVRGATFALRAGEIVGIAAVEGAGQHELLRALAGRLEPSSGRLERPARVAFIPEDRHHDALALDMSLVENVQLRDAGRARGRVDWRAVAAHTRALVDAHDVRAASEREPARTLSGGNQQKLVLARELAGDPPLVVAANPTRGLDVRATAAVHERLRAARDGGAAVVVYSSDLDEVLLLADRVLVVHAGHVSEAPRERDAVGRLMVGA